MNRWDGGTSVASVDTPTGATPTDRPARTLTRFRSRRWALAAALAVPALLAGCKLPSFGGYSGATRQGHDSFKLWQGFFVIGIVIGVIVTGLILWAVVRYRRKSEEIPKQTQYHTLIEILYTSIPILIVFGLFAFTVVTENEVTATPPGQVQVQVTAFQWGWQFYYPATGKIVEGTTTQAPQMEVPVGETVNVALKSADVIHGFYVPAFNYSEYAQPGYTNHFNINVLRSGVYRGQCTQLCGLYHSLMFFSVKAVPPPQFQSWVRSVSKANFSINQLKSRIAAQGQGA